MTVTAQIAKHLRDVHFGGNWTVSNFKDHLKDVTWQQATTQIHSFNTLATLVFHVNYYVDKVIKVLEGGPLTGKDEESFALPPIHSQEDWGKLLDKMWAEAEVLAALIEQLPDSKLEENFTDGKYGTYYRNFAGIIEHFHYHLGQVVLIKKLVVSQEGK
jgi:hypothetical protein